MKDWKSCNKKACLLPVALLYCFFFGYEFLVHGVLLKSMYAEYAALWRPQTEQAVRTFSLLRYLIMAGVLTCMFKVFRAGFATCGESPEASSTRCPIKSGGLCFGIKIGMLMGIWSAGCFAYLPIPASMAAAWYLAGQFEGIGAGLLLAMVCPLTPACEKK